jgi:hypothetical protein
MTTTQTIDLSGPEAVTHSRSHVVDPFLVGVLTVLLVMWAVGLWIAGPTIVSWVLGKRITSLYGWEVVCLVAVFTLYGLVVLWILIQNLSEAIPHRGRGPIRLEVSERGFALVWARGSPAEWRWARLRRTIVIEDFTRLGSGHGARLKVTWLLWAALNREAVDAILGGAESHGFQIKTRPSTDFSGGLGRRVIVSGRSRGTRD